MNPISSFDHAPSANATASAAPAHGARPGTRHHVVIIGAGFGGLSAAMTLARAPVDVTVIDRQNHHLFQPLLYQVATAALSPAEIAQPIRAVLKGQTNTRVRLDSVVGVDTARRQVLTESGHDLSYDSLIIASGVRHSYFGRGDWAKNAPGIKSIDDATLVRRRILLAFERAEIETDPVERQALQTFVVVGAGPTGVEISGALAELARRSIADDFRSITAQSTRIILVEAGPRLLADFPSALAERARQALVRLGVEVSTGTRVEDVTDEGVTLNGRFLPARTVIWAAGVKASAAGEWLGCPTDRVGRVVVGPDFSVPGHPEVFVIGDTAAYHDPSGNVLPGVAQVAKQGGRFVARLILARMAGRAEPAFHYRDFGSLATVGRKTAIADFGFIQLSGLLGWILWSFAHIWFLIGFRNRLVVATSWAWSYLTWQRGVRLITGLSVDKDDE